MYKCVCVWLSPKTPFSETPAWLPPGQSEPRKSRTGKQMGFLWEDPALAGSQPLFLLQDKADQMERAKELLKCIRGQSWCSSGSHILYSPCTTVLNCLIHGCKNRRAWEKYHLLPIASFSFILPLHWNRAVVTAPSCWSSRSIWTTLWDIGSVFGWCC